MPRVRELSVWDRRLFEEDIFDFGKYRKTKMAKRC